VPFLLHRNHVSLMTSRQIPDRPAIMQEKSGNIESSKAMQGNNISNVILQAIHKFYSIIDRFNDMT
jgi:hypothetical protein